MKVFKEISKLQNELNKILSSKRSIGFVPTMGALHEGHMSLVKRSQEENDITIVSIFVNPTQFNEKNDYLKYPRLVSSDIVKLEKINCDIVFAPLEEDMYPENDNREFEFDGLDVVMEGKYRPRHFRGVALIVTKLFDIVKPDRAYFGSKDFQQVAIIKQVVKKYNIAVEIIACPIEREKDGLAMSSRNIRLDEEQRKNVPLISKSLFEISQKAKSLSLQETKQLIIRKINDNPFLEVEYFDIVNEKDLSSLTVWDKKILKRACIAVYVGNVRLIDNVRINL
ncbi:MAG: pantoate--beta-alanine ligase [Bacteroidales bacterium]|jgi:pantoate--beta-alanine ligase|nr:pantoate--beta-alanine ligase [Bacteroidales bacterium]